jgi:hypothetical protein
MHYHSLSPLDSVSPYAKVDTYQIVRLTLSKEPKTTQFTPALRGITSLTAHAEPDAQSAT